jgi:acyl-ACP thioesterase
MTDLKKSWEDEYSIPFCEVDTKKEVFLPTLWNLMQETAWHHAENLRVGYSDLVKHQHFWVLSRLSIQMEMYPRWGDRIKIKTWLAGTGRLFALRNFSILNSNGDIGGTAKSAWLVLDLKSRKAQRIEPVFRHFRNLLDSLPPGEEPEKISGPSLYKIRTSFKVQYSDIDMHQHVNNTKYIEWILNSYPLEIHQNYRVQTIQINYIGESSEGDEISVHSETVRDFPPVYLHGIFREDDARELCRARVSWVRIHQ